MYYWFVEKAKLSETTARYVAFIVAVCLYVVKLAIFLYCSTLVVHFLVYDYTHRNEPPFLGIKCSEDAKTLLSRYVDYDLKHLTEQQKRLSNLVSEEELCAKRRACNYPEASKVRRVLCEHHYWIASGLDFRTQTDASPLWRFLTTFTIAATAFCLSYFLSLGISLTLALIPFFRRYGELIKTFIFVVSLIPVFIIGPFLKRHFSGLFSEDTYRPLAAFIALAIGNGILADFIRMLSVVLETDLKSNFIRMARAKGLPFWPRLKRWRESVLFHLLRHSLVSTLPLLSTKSPFFVGGAIVIELSVNINGIGKTFVYGFSNESANDILIGIFLTTLLVFLYNTLFRMIERWLNPKIHLESIYE